MAGYSQELEKAAHWSSVICISLSWLFQASSALLGWKGSRNAEEVLSWGNHTPAAPITPICGTGNLGGKGAWLPQLGQCRHPSLHRSQTGFSSWSLSPPLALSMLGSQCFSQSMVPISDPGQMILCHPLHSQVILCS